MTRGQRRAHLVMWLVLGPLAAGVLAAAVWGHARGPQAAESGGAR